MTRAFHQFRSARSNVLYFCLSLILSLSAVLGFFPAHAPALGSHWTDPLASMPAIATGFLANSCNGNNGYIDNPDQYHLGNDYGATVGTEVRSIGAGTVINVGSFGTGWGNAAFIKYKDADGSDFVALYGHINYTVSINDAVTAGQTIGTIAAISTDSHLHLGIRPGTTYPASNWGKMPCTSWPANGSPDTNGFVDPVPYLTSHPPTWATPAVASTENSTGGDFNGDGYDDVAIAHQISDGGADIQVLYGGTGTPFQYPTTFTRRLAGADGWDWTKMKFAVGHFNGDKYADLAILHQLSDGGADVDVLYGSAGTPFQYNPTFARHLYGSDGWNWSQMKVVSGNYNGDGYDDIAIVHQISDGGADIQVLYGSSGTPFQNPNTWARRLPGTDGWNWSQMKVASGMFDGDKYADIAILHQLSDGGADVHVLLGASSTSSTPFQNTNTWVRRLSGSDGWVWSKMKLAAGAFNGGTYADVGIIHQLSDGGADVHILYGTASGTPFQYTTTFARHLYGTDGWNWSQMKLANGLFNTTSLYASIAIIHQISDGGADVHVLYGSVGGTPFQYNPTFARHLYGSDGWVWTQMKTTY